MKLARGTLCRATFVDRPNRFLVRCDADGIGRVRAFVANPGRMHELLLPGARLYLDRLNAADAGARRKTAWTVQAVERDGRPICLNTHATNRVARFLIERGRIPTLEGASVLRTEIPVGRSRFDLLLEHRGRKIFTEVKSVTLYGNGVAMFPDAVTARGRRHLLELAELARRGRDTQVLFIVHTPQVEWFMPDFHTDPQFAEALLEVHRDLPILAVAVSWRRDLRLGTVVKPLEIPWDWIGREARDAGAYLLILRLPRPRTINVGGLGRVRFKKGFYVYIGSAVKNLSRRLERHKRKRKRLHWHIDYFAEVADEITPLPVRASASLEQPLVRAVGQIMSPGPIGFGASDSPCNTHLFHGPTPPLEDPRFHEVLQRFRMRGPE